jgi:hypothetical protein
MALGGKETMKWFHIVAVWLALIGASAEAVQPEEDAARVQQDVRALIHALYNADVDTVVRYTHPTIIAMQGGVQGHS